MQSDFNHRRREIEREQEELDEARRRHRTMEFVKLEQSAAEQGSIPSPLEADVAAPPPSLWTRIKRALFGS